MPEMFGGDLFSAGVTRQKTNPVFYPRLSAFIRGLPFPLRLKAPSSLLRAPSQPPPILHRLLIPPLGRLTRTPLMRRQHRIPFDIIPPPLDPRWNGLVPRHRFRLRLLMRAVDGFALGLCRSLHVSNQQSLHAGRDRAFTPYGVSASFAARGKQLGNRPHR